MADPKDRDADGGQGRRKGSRRANTQTVKQIERLDARIDDVADDVVEVRESVARMEGGMQQLVGAYNRTAEYAAQQASAELELRKGERLARVADTAAEGQFRREVRREVIFKLMAAFTAVWAIVASALAAKC